MKQSFELNNNFPEYAWNDVKSCDAAKKRY